MALVQPTNLFPSSFRGSGGDVIDASVENTFSLQLNGSSPCVAYSMRIMRNDTASTVVYTQAKTTLSTPIYPRNYLNEPQRLSITVPSNSGMANGYANGYKWEVTLYWSNSDSITSSDTFFMAQATPYFTVTNNPYTLTSKSITLQATYTQTDGVPLEWYRWTLTDDEGRVVADSGEVYSEDIQFEVDGLLSGESFSFLIVGEAQNGVSVGGIVDDNWALLQDVNGEDLYDVNGVALEEADDGQTHYTNEGQFAVLYDAPVVEGAITATCDSKTGGVTLSFTGVNVIQGTSTGTLTYVDDTPMAPDTSVQLSAGATITFDTVHGSPMDLPADATHIWSGTVVARYDGYESTLYSYTVQDGGVTHTGELRYMTYYQQLVFYYYYDGEMRAETWMYSDGSCWATAIMNGPNVHIRMWRYSSIYPSNELSPSNSLFPDAGGGWDVFKDFGNAWTAYEPSSSAVITSIVMNGIQTANYIKIVSGSLSEEQRETYLDIYYSDGDEEFPEGTILFAKFNGDLSAGNYETGSETLEGWDVYKQAEGTSSLQYIASVGASASSITDYLVPNGLPYYYYLFPRGLTKLGAPVVSDAITSKAWNWVLFEATESADNSNVLTVTASYVFQANVDSGTISNNAQSNVLHNFTQYPKILKGTQNYKSGKLSALVGYVDTVGNSYTETSALRNALYALSVSQNRMFLKNRAGDIWEVSVHGAVNMDVTDTSAYQPHTASIEWTEIGPITGLSLVSSSISTEGGA